jgi:uncharacterized membrane protein YhhN
MTFLILSIASALLDWYAVATKNRNLEYFMKPATMIFLIIWFITRLQTGLTTFSLFVLLGLFFSLCGDVFLMLPANRFLAGLIAFLIAHLAYIVAFSSQGLSLQPWTLLFALVILAAAVPIYLRLRTALLEGGNASLVIPVTIYVFVISFMVWSASMNLVRQDWSLMASLFVAFGAVSFFASDAVLAWNRFVRPLTQGNLIVIILYHLAQVLIATGALQRLGVL